MKKKRKRKRAERYFEGLISKYPKTFESFHFEGIPTSYARRIKITQLSNADPSIENNYWDVQLDGERIGIVREKVYSDLLGKAGVVNMMNDVVFFHPSPYPTEQEASEFSRLIDSSSLVGMSDHKWSDTEISKAFYPTFSQLCDLLSYVIAFNAGQNKYNKEDK